MNQSNRVNLLSLAAIQIANALTPLLLFPYVLTIVGSDAYSKLAMTEAIAIAALTFVLYSFEVDGIARLVKLDWHKERHKVMSLFSAVTYIRLLIFSIFVLFVLVVRLFVEPIIADLLLLWLALPLSYAIQPSWLFQAIENNKMLAIFTVVSRLLSGLFVILLVKKPEDVILVPAFIGSFYLSSALASLAYARWWLHINFVKLPLHELFEIARQGKKIFIGNLSVVLYRDLNVVILGLAHGSDAAIAAYSIAEKLMKGLQATMRPLNQIYFPKTLKQLGSNRSADKSSLKDIMKNVYPQFQALAVIVFLMLIAYFYAIEFSQYKNDLPEHKQIFILSLLMLPAIFFGITNAMLGIAGLNFLGNRTYMYKSLLSMGGVNLILCYLLSLQFGEFGTAISLSIVEGLLLAAILKKYLV